MKAGPSCFLVKFSTFSQKNRCGVDHVLIPIYCFSLQYQRLKECINNGGGICKLAVSLESLASLDELVNNNAIVMSVDGTLLSSLDNNRKQWVEEALSFVKRYVY